MPSKIQKELRKDIGKLVNDLNKNLAEYYQSGERVEIFEQAIAQSGIKAHGKGRAGGLSKGWNINKISELKAYKRELERLTNFDMFTPAAIRRQEALNEKAFKSFTKNHPNVSRTTYNMIGDVFKQLPEGFKEMLGSDQIVDTAMKAMNKGMSADKLIDIIQSKVAAGERGGLSVEQVQISIINSIKYGRRNRG